MPAIDAYPHLHGDFRWQVPPDFNIAEACCTRWAHSERIAVRWSTDAGAAGTLSYRELDQQARRLAAALRRLGVQPGDRVAVVMPQRPETAVAQIALSLLGAVAMPLSMLFGPDALDYRLQDSSARVAIVDESAIVNVLAVRNTCPALQTVVAVGGAAGRGDIDWTAALARERGTFTARRSKADDPAVLIYTSGTTGPPKGALIPHRALIGNLSGLRLQPELVSSRGTDGRRRVRRRRVLEPGRLGLDRRPDGRAAAHAVLRPPHRGLQRPLRA